MFNKYPYTDFHELNLDWLLCEINKILDSTKGLNEWKEKHEKEYEELKKFKEDIENGNFTESIKIAFFNWCKENLIDLVGEIIHNVFFGLTDSGYFVAYIPESWNDIIFNTTGLDITIEDVEYGRLILSY